MDATQVIDIVLAPSGRRFQVTLYRPMDYIGNWRLVMADAQVSRTELEPILARLTDMSRRLDVYRTEQLQLVDDIQKLLAPPAAPTSAAAPAAGAETRVWDTSEDALDEYDAAALVALKADHRADNHAPESCRVCATLERRLGAL